MVQMLKWEGLLVKKRYSNSDFAARTLILLQDALHLAVTSRSLSAAIYRTYEQLKVVCTSRGLPDISRLRTVINILFPSVKP